MMRFLTNSNFKIIVICTQSLIDIKGATRAYNMYRSLERRGYEIIYLDGWNPSRKLIPRNVLRWIQLVLISIFYKRKVLFIENTLKQGAIKSISLLKFSIILYIRDDRVLHSESMGISLTSQAKLQLETNTKCNFQFADAILVPSSSLKEYYSNSFNKKFDHKITVIMNATDINHFSAAKNSDGFTVGYIGGVNKDTGIELMLEACVNAKKLIPRLHVKIAYSTLAGTEQYIENAIKQYSYKWIEYTDSVRYISSPDFFKSIDVFVISRKLSKINEMATPSKMFDAMASGTPIIATNLAEQAEIILNCNAGVICDFTIASMTNCIIGLLRKPELLAQLAENGRDAALRNHNWDVRVNDLISIINEIVFKNRKCLQLQLG